MQNTDFNHQSNREMQLQNEPLVAILVAPEGPKELWVLGNERGEASSNDIALGETWVKRLTELQQRACSQ